MDRPPAASSRPPAASSSRPAAVPVLLLKTPSTPSDSYHETLSAALLHGDRPLAPEFVPVMRHRFDDSGLSFLRTLLLERRISHASASASYGGLIFTSQRAVEAFIHVVDGERAAQGPSWPHLDGVPVYSVGPATTRALAAVPGGPLQVSGGHTGHGEALARFILQDYAARFQNDGDGDGQQLQPPALLFLVGEQRRDIIPRTLTDPSLPPHRRVPVTERVVYGTGVMETFPDDFAQALHLSATTTTTNPGTPLLSSRWVVVFSPTGCDSMLRGLGLLDQDTGKAIPGRRDGQTFIATIGPTTRDFLIETFGFHPDVCAATPSPEGLMEGIAEFEARQASQ
ncbi:Tetrapyrrole biosynthesis, uroporphyrinogen III synthase [Cordyceps fumosorosea ARSEF 2679]|uniref:Tetrapyrrole biosynthesis, uroporphyrinogen III synthase n=1 Tax=Cordyceps fumosorosea (strain ARSEF 2679) TaxID=1081104 RepID=A0A168EGX2_CORFA|nr:Tetrapyrrole biosynthesis, uroporphyrinogen III synthase [Cordyceps fumosorosea ARSEF 2679]OAA73791.1 Tetrapyrrole biosynthesis, uroporphyrinogen III synthase [Cordyceps fumosorosea ARSEF 2679]